MSLLLESNDVINDIIESSLLVGHGFDKINPQCYIKLSFTRKTLRCWIRSWIKSRSWETAHANIYSRFIWVNIQSLLDSKGLFVPNMSALILDSNQDDTCQVQILHFSISNFTFTVRKRVHISELTGFPFSTPPGRLERVQDYLLDFERYIHNQIYKLYLKCQIFYSRNGIFICLKGVMIALLFIYNCRVTITQIWLE